MSAALKVLRAGPAMTVQDLGRPGQLAFGLSPGGAADPVALAEGAALLAQGIDCAALEMAAFGGEFEAQGNLRIALTGAPMQVTLDGEPLLWNASHRLSDGQRLTIGATQSGNYGYLHVGGGLATPGFLNSRSAHLAGGIGKPVAAGDLLPVLDDPRPDHIGQKVTPVERFHGGTVRVLPSVHTTLFSAETHARFAATCFSRTPRGNRQGAELAFEGAPFASSGQLSILSESMVVGDIQMTGDGHPFVLLPECQTTGGYPRIGTIVPDDLPIVVQAAPGIPLSFRFVTRDEALARHDPAHQLRAEMARRVGPLIRSPHDIPDLLGYQLISGAITGWEDN